jgi:hypothetical protein
MVSRNLSRKEAVKAMLSQVISIFPLVNDGIKTMISPEILGIQEPLKININFCFSECPAQIYTGLIGKMHGIDRLFESHRPDLLQSLLYLYPERIGFG